MKKFYIYLFAAIVIIPFLLSACESDSSREKEYEAVREKELQSGIRSDTLLFGLTIGTPKDSVMPKLERLKKTNPNIGVVGPVTAYTLKLNSYEKDLNFNCIFLYHQDKLYAILLYSNMKGIGVEGYEKIYNELTEKYTAKYGKRNFEDIDKDLGATSTWIRGNRDILIIKDLKGISIQYLDWTIAKKVYEEDLNNPEVKEEKNNSYEKNQPDI